jgi:hypothetical protein
MTGCWVRRTCARTVVGRPGAGMSLPTSLTVTVNGSERRANRLNKRKFRMGPIRPRRIGRIGMYHVKNNRRLARQLLANVCGRPAVIVDLRDATAFIAMHGDRTPAWLKAAVAVERADRDARAPSRGSLRIVASGVKEDPGRADDVKLEDDDFTPSRRSRGTGDHGRRTLPSLRAVQPATYRRNRWVSSK